MNTKLKEEETQDVNGDKPYKNGHGHGTFWTVCPYCYYLYEYDGVYEECCLRCQNCRRAFQAVAVVAPPVGMVVEGKEQYYCGIGCFALKYNLESFLGDKKGESGGGGAPFLSEKKENNEGFKADCENMVVISDDSDSELGNNEKGKDKNGKNSDGIGSVDGNFRVGEAEYLMQGSLKTEIKNDGKKGTRKVKSVAFKTKKLMGRGKKHLKLESSGNLGMAGAEMDVGEGTKETIPGSEDRKGSMEWAFNSEIDLEFFLGEDDVYVG